MIEFIVFDDAGDDNGIVTKRTTSFHGFVLCRCTLSQPFTNNNGDGDGGGGGGGGVVESKRAHTERDLKRRK
jgi:hypothetical protein